MSSKSNYTSVWIPQKNVQELLSKSAFSVTNDAHGPCSVLFYWWIWIHIFTCVFTFIQYIAINWPWYSLRGLHIRITWFSLNGIRFSSFSYVVSIFPCFPYMVMLLKHLNVKTIVLERTLLWAAMDTALSHGPLLWRHNDTTAIVSWNTSGPKREPRRSNHGPSID